MKEQKPTKDKNSKMVDLILVLLNISTQFLFKDKSCQMTRCLELREHECCDRLTEYFESVKFAFCCSDKHSTKSTVGEKQVYLIHRSQFIPEGRMQREKLREPKGLEVETTEECHLLACFPTTQVHLFRNHTPGAGPS